MWREKDILGKQPRLSDLFVDGCPIILRDWGCDVGDSLKNHFMVALIVLCPNSCGVGTIVGP